MQIICNSDCFKSFSLSFSVLTLLTLIILIIHMCLMPRIECINPSEPELNLDLDSDELIDNCDYID